MKEYKKSKRLWGKIMGKANQRDNYLMNKPFFIGKKNIPLLKVYFDFLIDLDNKSYEIENQEVEVYSELWRLQRHYRISDSTLYRVVSCNKKSTSVFKKFRKFEYDNHSWSFGMKIENLILDSIVTMN